MSAGTGHLATRDLATETGGTRLAELEAGLTAAFETALDAVVVADDGGGFLEVNPAACELFGRSRRELLEMKIEEAVVEQDLDEAKGLWREFVNEGDGRARGVLRLRRSDGSTLLVEYSTCANFVPGQHLAVLRDVTERRRAELEATEAKRRLEETQALAQVGSWEWDPRHDTSRWSLELMRMTGLDPITSAPGLEGILDMVVEADRPRVEGEVRAALKETGRFELVFQVQRADGEVRAVESRGQLERDDDGNPVRLFGAAQDITERLDTEDELRVQGQILDQVEAGIFTINHERRVTHWSRGAERLYGWTREEAVGRRGSELKLISLRSLEAASEARDRTLSGRTWEGNLELIHKHGRTIQVQCALSPVISSDGEVAGIVAVTVDVSEQKRHEDELARSREETIHRLARAMETRDRDTGGHIERIGAWAAMIGGRVGLPRGQVEGLRVASPMHDVGKIGISDQVLRKPGPLTVEERAEMERHVDIGHRILAGSGVGVLDLAAEIALTHHEWFDGTGYPRGLRGQEIPLSGRIVAVADVFDALTSDRVYRPAMPVHEAIELMRSERGTHFDPEVLDVLLDDVPAFTAEHVRTGRARHGSS